MRISFMTVFGCLLVAFSILGSVVSVSAKLHVRSVPELVGQSELVLSVVVGETRETVTDDGWTYLATTLEVTKVFKGKTTEKKLEVATRRFPAGKEDHPSLFPKPGVEAVVFLAKNDGKDELFKSPWILANPHQGIMAKGRKDADPWEKLLAEVAAAVK